MLKDKIVHSPEVRLAKLIRRVAYLTLLSVALLSFSSVTTLAQASHDSKIPHLQSSAHHSAMSFQKEISCADVCKLAATNDTQSSSFVETTRKRIKHPRPDVAPPLIQLQPTVSKIDSIPYLPVTKQLYIYTCCFLF